MRDFDLAILIADAADDDLAVGSGNELREFLAPFHEEQVAILGEEFIDAEGIEFATLFHAIEIDVEDIGFGATVLVNEGEGGAGDVLLFGSFEALGNSLHQGGLTGAEITLQQDEPEGSKFGRKGAPECYGLFGRVRLVFAGRHLVYLI